MRAHIFCLHLVLRARRDGYCSGSMEACESESSFFTCFGRQHRISVVTRSREIRRRMQAFEEGIKNDPRNATNYSGAIAAATLLKKPPTERVKILERYPDLSSMPTALVEELALSRAEAGNYRGAVELFKNRFFWTPRRRHQCTAGLGLK